MWAFSFLIFIYLIFVVVFYLKCDVYSLYFFRERHQISLHVTCNDIKSISFNSIFLLKMYISDITVRTK